MPRPRSSDRTLKRWYNKFNKKWFNNALPDHTQVFYDPSLESKTTAKHLTYGEADWENDDEPFIRIHPKLRAAAELKTIAVETLLHEMAHLAEYMLTGEMTHGKNWEKVMLRLAKLGAFSEKNGVVPNSLW